MFEKQALRSAVKSSFYGYVFNNFFNIGFHSPKSDRCNRCEEYKIKVPKKIPISEKGNAYFLSKAGVGSFLYKRKLTMYNLTASTSSKQDCCSIWTKMISERPGNDIASPFISI